MAAGLRPARVLGQAAGPTACMLAARTTKETTSAVTPNDNRTAPEPIPEPSWHLQRPPGAFGDRGSAPAAERPHPPCAAAAGRPDAQPCLIQPSGGSASWAGG